MSTETLTAQQESFSQGVASGLNQSEAYRQSYNTTDMLQETVHEAASHLAAEYKVTTRIAQLRETVTEANLMTRKEAFDEAGVILEGSSKVNQWGPANQANKTRIQLAGLQEQSMPGEVRITSIVINMPSSKEGFEHQPTIDAEDWHEVEEKEQGP